MGVGVFFPPSEPPIAIPCAVPCRSASDAHAGILGQLWLVAFAGVLLLLRLGFLF